MISAMNSRAAFTRLSAAILMLGCVAFASAKDNKPAPQAPKAGPRATPLEITWLYIQPDTGSQKVSQVQIGREMAVVARSGAWLNVEANTDIEEENERQDTPEMGKQHTSADHRLDPGQGSGAGLDAGR
jgi:hypothetical protein